MLGLVGVVIGAFGILVAISIPLEIERRKRPSLAIERADDLNPPGPEPFRIVHLRVTNKPLSGRVGKFLLRNVATGCRVVSSSRAEATAWKPTYLDAGAANAAT